jgi:hypothetical protein
MDYESLHEESPNNPDSEVNESLDQSMPTFEDDETNQNKDIFEDFEDVLENSDLNEESEIEMIEMNTSYPNEAYSDLMTLVTNHKLSNATGNAIIKFFNKHANLSTSPLPKSIEKGREYMDKMNIPNLTYNKTCVIKYNDKEYYLHHRSLINCVKHILSTPDILNYFQQKYKNLKVKIYVVVIYANIL